MMAGGHLRIFGFAGSLRKGSYNRMLLDAAAELLPEGASLENFDLSDIPVFNQDLEGALPEPVKRFKAGIKAADAILIVTPEYNYSVPGVLKNAIDWASRPHGDNSFEKKPVAIMSASPGMLGGSRAQYHLRQSFVFLNAYPMQRPEIFVAFADTKFDGEGRLTDQDTRDHVKTFLQSLAKWSDAIGRAGAANLI
ncbi:FMN-dependent NADH-azoreductase [uncultured archaeon]|nr:FMN-dependent NADH-azoreductase [uncultured archaeon]